MSQLPVVLGAGLNTGDIIFQLIAMLILLALLKKFALKPLLGIMKFQVLNKSTFKLKSFLKNNVSY